MLVDISSRGFWLFCLICIGLLVFLYRRLKDSIHISSVTDSGNSSFISALVHFQCGVAETTGRRPYMEDRHLAVGHVSGRPDCSFYAVFDGHGGTRAADFCVEHLVDNLTSQGDVTVNPSKALTQAFVTTDQQFLEIASRSRLDDGTTAIVALVCQDRLFVANVGDSRAVVVRHNGQVVALSDDHKPNRQDERSRITRLGGRVVHLGVWRVEGVLAVSRAIGDRTLKKYVSAEPDIRTFQVSTTDRFLVLASDGLWDVVTNEEVGELACGISNAQEVARMLVDHAFNRCSTDNITALVVDLQQQTVVQATPAVATTRNSKDM